MHRLIPSFSRYCAQGLPAGVAKAWRALAIGLGLALMLLGCADQHTSAETEVASAAAGKVTVSQARYRDLLPGKTMTAAYFDVFNAGEKPIQLIGVSSDAARVIEMHTMTMLDGRMQMRALDQVEIAAGEQISFTTGGRHLMVMGVESLGDEEAFSLHFADGSALPVMFRKTLPMPSSK